VLYGARVGPTYRVAERYCDGVWLKVVVANAHEHGARLWLTDVLGAARGERERYDRRGKQDQAANCQGAGSRVRSALNVQMAITPQLAFAEWNWSGTREAPL